MIVTEKMFTNLYDEQAATAKQSIVLAAIVIGLHFGGVNIQKIDIGGNEILFSNPRMLFISIGIVLLYFLLLSFRFFFMYRPMALALQPDFEQHLVPNSKKSIVCLLLLTLVQGGTQITAICICFYRYFWF